MFQRFQKQGAVQLSTNSETEILVKVKKGWRIGLNFNTIGPEIGTTLFAINPKDHAVIDEDNEILFVYIENDSLIGIKYQSLVHLACEQEEEEDDSNLFNALRGMEED